MPTAAAQRRLDRDLLEFKRAASAGDISTQQYDRIVREVTVDAMTPAERTVYDETKARHDIEDQQNLNRLRLAREGGDNLSRLVLRQKDSNPYIKELREVSLSGDWNKLFQLIPLFKWGYKGNPLVGGVAFPLGKFRFNWGADGKPVYVPFTEQDLINYVVPQRVFSQPIMYKCSPDEYAALAANLFSRQLSNEQQFPASDWRHVLPIYPRSLLCTRPKESLWMKIRYPVVIAMGIVAAIYLGPMIADKVGGLFSGSGSSAAAASEKATLFTRIKSGTESALSVVNKARTIEAIAKGELPPPPIGIAGNSFREWVFIVAKDEIKKTAQEKALEMGQKYIAKKLSQKEEAKLRAEIAAMQRELEALVPKNIAPQPDQTLAPAITDMQVLETQKAGSNKELLKMALIIGIPAALFLVGA